MNHNMIEHWVRQAQNGNREAFNKLAESFRDAAFYEAFRWLGDSHSAEDAAQDAFIAAYTHLDQLRSPGKFGAWFRQIVRSQCNLQTRRKKPRLEALDETPHLSAPTLTPEHIIERREDQEMVREAIDSLPEHERIVTEEYYLNGEKQSDIAEKLGIPVTTVKKRLQYARKKLKGMIEQLTLRDPDNLPSWRELKRIFAWLPPTWRRIRNYERNAAQLCYLLFFAHYTDTLAYRKPDDEPRNRHLDL
jgi:RNA polymerase sigma factor (sigma-70 family)